MTYIWTLGSMREHPQFISAGGRWLIFAGLPLAICAILFVLVVPHDRLVHFTGEKFLPYVLFFGPAAIVIGFMVLYDHFPKRLIIPVGIIGWIVHFSALGWFFWFGPGVYGHH